MNHQIEVSTSLLGVEKEEIIKTIYRLEEAKTDYLHIDVMDGEFVENNTNDKMLSFCEYCNGITNIPLDVHLMVKDIKNYIESYSIFSPNVITFHYEACENDQQVLELIHLIKEKHARVGISIKPNTPVEKIYPFLPFVHLILIMTVEPGKGAQPLLDFTLDKIKQLKEYIEQQLLEVEIEADGGIKPENAQKVKNFGCNILVSGTGILKASNFTEAIQQLKQ